jgi:hypothetical protein
LNWWTEFSSWQDFRALLLTGSRLSIHTVVEIVNQKLENIETIDEKGNIEVELSETTDENFRSGLWGSSLALEIIFLI